MQRRYTTLYRVVVDGYVGCIRTIAIRCMLSYATGVTHSYLYPLQGPYAVMPNLQNSRS